MRCDVAPTLDAIEDIPGRRAGRSFFLVHLRIPLYPQSSDQPVLRDFPGFTAAVALGIAISRA
jgi:hypothetical protein